MSGVIKNWKRIAVFFPKCKTTMANLKFALHDMPPTPFAIDLTVTFESLSAKASFHTLRRNAEPIRI